MEGARDKLVLASRFDTPARAAGYLPRVWSRVPTKTRTLFLTFDDGPSAATATLLDLFHGVGAQASFFVLGEQLAASEALLIRMRDEGHAIGSHGWHHADPWRVRDDNRWTGAETAIQSCLGRRPYWLRPPYGHLTYGLWQYARTTGQQIALWDLMARDFDTRRPLPLITDDVRRRVRPGSIVVLHDGHSMKGRIELLAEQLVPALQQDGWTLAALPDHPGGLG